MSQVLESAAMSIPDKHDKNACPFCKDDDSKKDDEVTTYEGNSKHLSAALEMSGYTSPQGNWKVFYDTSEIFSVPNAHHLIPAEASLHGEAFHEHPSGDVLNRNPHAIMRYMSASAKGSEIESDIGYNVNKEHNGIWLPSIPVEFKELKKDGSIQPAAIEKWGKLSPNKKQSIPELFMKKYSNKLGYYGSQWHQTHKKYSKKVENCLQNFVEKLEGWDLKKECPVCQDNNNDSKLPPPYGLLTRLKGLSLELRSFLGGDKSKWKTPMFTSTQAKKYFNKP